MFIHDRLLEMGKINKIGSISFFLSIPVSLFFAWICFSSSLELLHIKAFEKTDLSVFIFGLLASGVIVGTSKIPKLRTFVHEFKHAVMIFLTGNRLKDFHFEAGTGHVKYSIYSDKLRFEPFISLAPYFLPIFSFPVLLIWLVASDFLPPISKVLLGITLGADLIFSYQEIHGHQSDFHKIRGGLISSFFFIICAVFLWVNICFLWILAEHRGFVFAGKVLLQFIKDAIS